MSKTLTSYRLNESWIRPRNKERTVHSAKLVEKHKRIIFNAPLTREKLCYRGCLVPFTTITNVFLSNATSSPTTLSVCEEVIMKFYWVGARQNQTNDLCAQWRLQSAWTSTQSDQCLRCALSGFLRTHTVYRRTAKTLVVQADSEDSGRTGRMPRLIWVFTGRTGLFLFFSCLAYFIFFYSRRCLMPCEGCYSGAWY